MQLPKYLSMQIILKKVSSKMKSMFSEQHNFPMHLSIFEVPKTKGVNTSELLCSADVRY
jgi:hypothetical protein